MGADADSVRFLHDGHQCRLPSAEHRSGPP